MRPNKLDEIIVVAGIETDQSPDEALEVTAGNSNFNDDQRNEQHAEHGWMTSTVESIASSRPVRAAATLLGIAAVLRGGVALAIQAPKKPVRPQPTVLVEKEGSSSLTSGVKDTEYIKVINR